MRSLVGELLPARTTSTDLIAARLVPQILARKDAPPVAYSREQAPAFPFISRSDLEAQQRTYGTEPVLFACVNRLANSVAQVPWRLYRKAPSGKIEDRVEITSHAALDLWQMPNNFYTGAEFVEASDQHLELTGESYWVIGTDDRAPDLPLSLWPVRPDKMTPVPHPTDFLSGYIYHDPDGRQIPFGLDEVIHIKYPDPLDPYHGLGPVRALLVDLDASRFSAQWNRNFFMNSAEPGGIIEVDQTLTDERFNELSARWAEQHRGTARAHRVAILEEGMQWKDRGFSMKDMQFVALRKVSDEHIMLAFGMSKTLLGQTEGVNRATAEAAEYVFGKYQTTPRLERVKAVLNTRLLPRFRNGELLEFDYDSPITDDVEQASRDRESRVTVVTSLIAAGFDPIQTAAAYDLPDLTLGASAGGEGSVISPRDQAEMIQKVYLGVNTVVTWEEAREVLRAAGLDLANIAQPSSPPIQVATPVAALGPGNHHHRSLRLRPRGQDDPPDLDPADLPDITALEESFQRILADLLARWTELEADQKAELVDLIAGIAGDGSITDLADLDIDTDATAKALEAAMLEMSEEAADAVVDEAAAQGVTVDPRHPAAEVARDVAVVVAALIGGRLAAGAASAAMRANGAGASPTDVATAVEDHLDGLSTDGPKAMLSGALTGAQNDARVETLRAAPEAALYSSEENDSNTCGPCRAVSGKWLGNVSDIDQVLDVYPGGGFGGFIDCEGRERCRGTVVAVWRPETVNNNSRSGRTNGLT